MKTSTLACFYILLSIVLCSTKLYSQNFVEAIKAVASDRAANDQFGVSVAISGDRAIVGAYLEDEDASGGATASQAGAAYIFERDGSGTWSEVQKIVASDRAVIDRFGVSVAISGDRAIVGANFEDEDASGGATASQAGAAYIFERDGAGTWSEVQKIVASDRAAIDHFGVSVAISGDRAIVGANLEDEDASGGATASLAGAAYIFERDGAGNWSEVQKIVASDRAANDQFGVSVAISGDRAIVGAFVEDHDASGGATAVTAGAAYIFERDGAGTWSEVQKIVASDRAANDQFGVSVAISGDRAIVGAYFEDEDASGGATADAAGAAYIFERDGAGNWSEVQKIVASDRAAIDLFGFSVAISGDRAIVSAFVEDHDASGGATADAAGAAYIFERDGAGNWSEVQKIVASDRAADDRFGVSVAISGDRAIVGAFVEDHDASGGATADAAGAAYIFNYLCSADTFYITNCNPADTGFACDIFNTSGCDSIVCTNTTLEIDNQSPTIFCIQDIGVGLDPVNGTVTVPTAVLYSFADDNCGLDTIFASQNFFTCADVGFPAITLTAVDYQGNSITCTAMINIQDNEAPAMVCQNATVYVDSNGTAILKASAVDGGTTDNCGVDTLYVSPNNFGCNFGDTTVTLYAIDVNGNIDSCDATVSIKDSIRAVAVCIDTSICLDSNGMAIVDPALVDGGSYDNCEIVSFFIDDDTVDCLDTSVVITLNMIDSWGHVSSCDATVKVLDKQPVKAICKEKAVVCLDSLGLPIINLADFDSASFDNCGFVTQLSCSIDCSTDSTSVLLTIIGNDGTKDSCEVPTIVKDSLAPELICDDVTVCLDSSGNATISPTDVTNIDSQFITFSYTGSIDTFTVPFGVTSVTIETRGAQGGSNYCLPTSGGLGAIMKGTFSVSPGDQFKILVGQKGFNSDNSSSLKGGGGGGGTYVTTLTNSPLIISGGGGGYSPTCSPFIPVGINANVGQNGFDGNSTLGNAPNRYGRGGINGNGATSIPGNEPSAGNGGGFLTNGNPPIGSVTSSGASFTNGGAGGIYIFGGIAGVGSGGFGGGGSGAFAGGGGGGGFSGGGGSWHYPTNGGGGGSFNAGSLLFATVGNTGNGSVTISYPGVSRDNCGIKDLSIDDSTFSCTDVGQNIVVLTATDVHGNSSSCTVIVTVKDNIPLTITCPDSINVANDPDSCSANVTFDDAVAMDNCLVSLAQIAGLPSGSDFPVGRDTITYLATDSNGNTAQCSFTVAVRDTQAVDYKCPNDTIIYVDDTCGFSVEYTFNVTDNCDAPRSVTFTYTGSTGFNQGQVGLGDAAANLNSCYWTITGVDTLPPMIFCPADDTVYVASDSCVFTVFDAHLASSPSATDNCMLDTLEQTVGLAPGSKFPVGVNTLTYKASDTSGNTSECSFNIVVRDTFPPEAICEDVFIYLDNNGQASVSAIDVAGNSTDNCMLDYSFASDSSVNTLMYNCDNEGSDSVRVFVSDSENADSCDAVIYILDTIPPEAVCKNIDIYLDKNGLAVIEPSDIDNGSSDNCGIDSMWVSQDTFDCEDIDLNMVELIAVDSGDCQDNFDSTMVIPFNFISSSQSALFDTTSGFSFNIPGIVSNIILEVYHRGDIDRQENSLSERLQVYSNNTLIGKTNLGFQCASSYTLTSFILADSLISSVVSNGIRLVPDQSNRVNNFCTFSDAFMVLKFDCRPYSYDICTAKVTVHDTFPPIAFCEQPQTVYLGQQKVVKLPASFFDGGSSDNCGNISLAIDEFEFDCTEIGPNTVVLTVTDDQGLTDTCHGVVNILDLSKPIALCNNQVTAYADINGNVVIDEHLIDNGSTDNCGTLIYDFDIDTLHCGSNVITMTVTDQSGNTASCQSTVLVIDTVSPTALCKDITVPLQPSGIEIISINDVEGGSWDGCGIESISISQNIFSCSDQGQNPETLTVTDINNNTSVCHFTVTVTDPSGVCTPPCGVPQNPTTSNITVSSATLSWDAVPGATHYILKGSEPGGPTIAISVSGTSYTADPLSKATTYVWDVTAVCTGNIISQPSEQDTFTTNSCDVPQNLQVTSLSPTSATLNWDQEDDAIGYILTGRPIGGGKVTLPISGGSTTSFTANSLMPNTSYIWTVNSVCDMSPQIVSAKAPVDTFTTLVDSGCTDPAAANYQPNAINDDGSCLYNITFRVDMSCMDPQTAFSNVNVTGPVVGWCANCLPLVDQGGGIWANTFQFPAIAFEYKYNVDAFASQENLVDDMQGGASCAPITDFFSFANRTVNIGAIDTVNDTYGSCSPCDTGAIAGCTDANAANYDPNATTDDGSCQYNVTFNVDMNCMDPMYNFSTVSITGPFCSFCASGFELSDPDSNGVYSGTFAMSSPLEFKYMVDGFASQEDLIDDMVGGASCAPITDFFSFANRLITFDSDTNTTDYYGFCVATSCKDELTKETDSDPLLDVAVYPNPNNGAFVIEVSGSQDDRIEIQILDLLGKTIFTDSDISGKEKWEMDLSDYMSGVYLVKIISGDEQIVKRVVVE